MASLKDIMNHEPPQSQTFQTSQQEQASRSLPQQQPQQDTRYTDSRYPPQPPQPRLPPVDTLLISSPISPQSSASSLSRKRSRRPPKTSTAPGFGRTSSLSPALGPGPNPSNPSSLARRRTSVGKEYMDPSYSQRRSISPSPGYSSSNSNSMRGNIRSATEPEQITERRTPVTGRISKAKKGLPVHKCPLCDRKPFSRAEHLRRHQLQHGEPRYRCTIQGCDKAFHRDDLLRRHIERHNETQSGQPSRRSDDNSRRSRSSSAPFNTANPPRTPPQQSMRADGMNMDASSATFSPVGAPPRIPASPIDANMNRINQYSPATSYRQRNMPSGNSQGYHQYEASLRSPIQLEAIPQYSGAPMVTYVETSPMVTHCVSSSLPAYNHFNTSAYANNIYAPVAAADNMQPFSTQLSQRLLTVDVPGSHHTPGPHPSSPYHSSSNSNFSTPSDLSKSHIWPPIPAVPRDRALSAPGSQWAGHQHIDMNYLLRQQQQQLLRTQQATMIGFGEGRFDGDGNDMAIQDEDCVSTAATYGTSVEGFEGERNADEKQGVDEPGMVQAQFEANGGQGLSQQVQGPQGYMEDFYEQWNC